MSTDSQEDDSFDHHEHRNSMNLDQLTSTTHDNVQAKQNLSANGDANMTADHLGLSDDDTPMDMGGLEQISDIAPSNTKGHKMPVPPRHLLESNPTAFLTQFMFASRPARMREADLDFRPLWWAPLTDEQRMRGAEELSTKLSALMNRNAELERRVKGAGPRRTKVLDDEVYQPVTVKVMRKEKWDREDVIWCICEGMKKWLKELAKNRRFKERLGLPTADDDDVDALAAAIESASVNGEVNGGQHNKSSKAAGGRGNARNAKGSGRANKEDAAEKNRKKRGIDESSSEDDNASDTDFNASPKKKMRTAKPKPKSKPKSAPATPKGSAAANARCSTTNARAKNKSVGGIDIRGLKTESSSSGHDDRFVPRSPTLR